MNAAETIAAAIEKLEGTLADSFTGRWIAAGRGIQTEHGMFYVVKDDGIRLPDRDLILILHRTIDAQLAILRNNLGGARDMEHGRGYADDPAAVDDALDLARAILGEVA